MATTTPTKSHLRSSLKIYFLLMTLVGVIWTLIAFGIFIFAIGKQVIITDEEYIVGERYYELENCKYNNYDNKESTKATAAEIKTCEEEKRAMLIQSRKATFKTDAIGWSIRWILFLMLLLVHYPRFMKMNKKD